MVFLTLTAPSFGPVHSRRVVDGQARRCRPRRKGEVCPHGVSLACNDVHDEDDPCLGEPLCPECFDYEHAVLWNALAPELWRYTSNQLPRELARLTGVSQKRLQVRVSYVKVAEFQRRGALHFHCVLRLDAVNEAGEIEAPAARYGTQLLVDAATAAARHVSVQPPAPGGELATAPEIRWGAQIEVRELDRGAEAASCAGYIAKYATKSTEAVGGLMYRLEAGDVQRLKVRPHIRRLVETAWRLGGQRHLRDLRLRRWAHQLGFRGHCFTKSRRYSTTFTALRQARHEHQLRRAGELHARRIGRWRYSGSGYRTFGDAWLAESGRKRALEMRRVARRRAARSNQRRETVMGVSRMPAGEQYVTAREVADRVGLSSDTILRYYRDGKIPGRRMPGQIRPVRFLWSEVEAAFNGIADQAAEQAREEWAGRVRGAAA